MDAANRDKLVHLLREVKTSTPTMDLIATQPVLKLRYSIAEASSYSGVYEPHNILYDRPHDLASRWSGAAVASLAPHSSSSCASGSGASNPPSSSAHRSSSPLTGGSRDGSSGVGSNKSGSSRNSTSHLGGEKQYIILQLDKMSILRKIYFGKYHKAHPCNLKDFKVYGSQSTKDARSNAWVRILRGGLRNDAQPEFFETRWTTTEGVPFPVKYVKLVPLATHTPNYNFSVWHIALEGISEPYTIERVTKEYQEHRESTAIRLILRHLRSRAYHSAFHTLLESCKLGAPQALIDPAQLAAMGYKRPFEHPIVTQLFNNLMRGAWDAAEECLEKAAWGDPPVGDESSAGRGSAYSETSSNLGAAVSLFSSYVERSMPKPNWMRITATDSDGDSPCGRGGHEMCLDSEKGVIWLYGGWDGSKDMADLWAYYIQEATWRCISRDVRQQGGPGPRSCHKMVFDPRTGFLYVLGKFIDYERVVTTSFTSARSNAAAAASPVALPNLEQRGSSPIDRQASPSTNPTFTPNRSATRGFFLPRVAGSGAEGAVQGSTADSPSDFMEELFGSTRGGSTRLGPGRTTFLGVDRANRGDGAAVTAAGAALSAGSGANSPSVGSPNPSASAAAAAAPTPTTGYEPDFYRFSTRTERWDRLSSDTNAEGGPKLVFDHQMIVDSDSQLLYVFGGRVAHPDANKVELSGMWKYDVIQRSWTFLFDDLTHAQSRIPSRVGHTMLLDVSKRGSMVGKKQIWVLAGQRNSQYLSDMWTYQPSTGAVREVSKDYSASNGPEGGFTQRASIDARAREIYLFSGLVKKSKSKSEKVKSAFWIYSIERGDWRLVYQYGGRGSGMAHSGGSEGEEELLEGGGNADGDTGMDVGEPGGGPIHAFPTSIAGDGQASWTDNRRGLAAGVFASEPQPRYAAQLIFDKKRKLFYIFGGNPADAHQSSLRLDDLWSLELVRPGLAEVLRRAKFKLRQQRFLELARNQTEGASGEGAGWGAMQALVYLQTQVSQVVNHDIAEESQAFRKLMAHLLSASSRGGAGEGSSPTGPSHDFGFPHLLQATGMMDSASVAAAAAAASLPIISPSTTEEAEGDRFGGVASDSDEAVDDEETEMLSISQVLPNAGAQHSNAGTTNAPLLDPSLGAEGQASMLYTQRYQLFKALLDFFPSEAIEPEVDLLDCIEISKLSF